MLEVAIVFLITHHEKRFIDSSSDFWKMRFTYLIITRHITQHELAVQPGVARVRLICFKYLFIFRNFFVNNIAIPSVLRIVYLPFLLLLTFLDAIRG